MIDWLRREREAPSVQVGDRVLPLAIRRHARATRLTMRLAPDGSEVHITLPQWGRTIDAVVFASKRIEWLECQLAAVPRVAPPEVGGTVMYRGHPVEIEWRASLPRKPALVDSQLRLGGPAETVPARVRRWLESEALRLMGEDLAHYCTSADQAVPDLRLSRANRRWGSCSGKGCIRLNWRLVQAPDAVRRSVVAHEVAHLVHFDHSPAFRALLAELFEGELGEADDWLRREGRGLYAAFG
ncbi:MAG: YgjP-like metallopeptidase domain-containing protein [Croceibacterium sp.]